MTAEAMQPLGKRRWPVVLLLFCLPVVFLFSRTPADNECMYTVTWAHTARFVHQCDSFSITTAAGNLEGYATGYNPWRSRPAYIAMVTVLGQALSPVATVIRFGLLQGRLRGNFKISTFLQRYPYYLALTVINFLVLGVALWLAFRLAGPGHSYLAPALGAVVASSDLVHAMIWSFHPSFIGLIVPLGGIFFFLSGCRASRMARSEAVTLGLVLAFGLLNYGFLAIWLPCFACGWLFWAWRENEGTAAFIHGAKLTALVAVIGFAPLLIWGWISESIFHLPVSFEATDPHYRQFLWVLDSWKAGNLANTVAAKWAAFFPQTLLWLGWPAAFAVAGSIGLAAVAPSRRPLREWVRDPILVGTAVVLLGMVSFNFLQGYYAPRLSNTATLALFVVLARIARVTGQEKQGTTLLLAATGLQIALAFFFPAISMT